MKTSSPSCNAFQTLIHYSKGTEAPTAEWTDLSRCFIDAATASLGFSTKKNTKTGSTATTLPSSSYFRQKCTSCCQASKSVIIIHCTAPEVERASFTCAWSSARLKTNGGLTKPTKSNSTQIQTRRRSSMTQLKQHTPQASLCSPRQNQRWCYPDQGPTARDSISLG